MRRYLENENIIQITVQSGDRRGTLYTSVKYPSIPLSFEDFYVYTTRGDRYDTLALQYYKDSSLWWVIANANGNLDKGSLTPPLGTQLRIPANPAITQVIYRDINNPTTTSNN